MLARQIRRFSSSARVGDRPLHINLWASPRSGSTSLMYSFAQRTDTEVVDEPLYAHYLTNINPNCHREYKEELLRVQNGDGDAVVRDLASKSSFPVLFSKHMSKHLSHLSTESEHALRGMVNVILFRHPMEVFDSFDASGAHSGAQTQMDDTGIRQQVQLLEQCQASGDQVLAVSYQDLTTRPEATVRALCTALKLPFQPSMLKWEAGARPEDGVWAPWWYANTHSSTGFQVGLGRSASTIVPPRGWESVSEEAAMLYAKLQAHRLCPEPEPAEKL